MVQQQIAAVEKKRDSAPTLRLESERKRARLTALRGIGPTLAAILTREIYYRPFENRRQVGSYIAFAPSPHDSGESERCSGISKAGNGLVRGVMIEAAWLRSPTDHLKCSAVLGQSRASPSGGDAALDFACAPALVKIAAGTKERAFPPNKRT